MRGILQFVAIVVVMVAARYVPFGNAMRWLVKPSSQPAIVTGSLQDQEQTGDAARQLRRPRDATADVRAILAQASFEKASGNNAPQRRPGGSRAREDETNDDGEIYIGGTGLLDESEKTTKEHPLAAKHPDDYLVICEAGCRPLTDRIVYKISKVSGVNAANAQRKLQVTSAADGVESNQNDQIVCLAGCYDDEPVKQRRAEQAREPAPVRTAQAGMAPRDEPAVQDRSGQYSADVPKDVAHVAPAPATPLAATALKVEAPIAAAVPPRIVAIASAAPEVLSSPEASAASVAAAVSPLPKPVPPPQKAIIAEAASVREIAAVHAISAEAAARRESKHASATVPVHQLGWEAKVTSLVVLPKPAKAARSVVALSTVAPFETTVAVEHGWDFTLSNTP